MKLYDAHNHLQDEWLEPHLDRIAADLEQAGVAGMVVNGTGPADWPQVAALARRYPWVIPSYGLHPWDCGNRPADWQDQLKAQLAIGTPAQTALSAKVGVPTVGLAKVGEIGIDRWILDRAKPDDPRLAGLRRAPLDEQIEVFVWQLNLAAELNRAASIHCIDAWGPLFDTLRTATLPARGFLLHAYAGPVEMIKPFADLGAYFSFNGSYLDDRRSKQRTVFHSVPSDRLLIETDSPAMPLRRRWRAHELPDRPTGTPVNHPANLAGVYAGLADFLGQPLPELAAQVEANFHRLFGKPAK